jgi:hypothetical protein
MGIRKIVVGLEGLYYSPVPASGLIADANWENLALHLEGTFNMNQAEDEQTDVYVEEQDVPVITILKKGKFTFESDVLDFQYDVAQKLLGATKSDSQDAEGKKVARVKMPNLAQYLYGMWKIVPRDGVEAFYIPYGQIGAYISGSLSKTEPLKLHLKVTALIPLNGETSHVMYDILEGTNPAYVLGNTFEPDYDIVDAWDGITTGALGAVNLTVSGVLQQVHGLDFSAISTVADIVDALNAATTGAIWSFDENEYRFKITTNAVGSSVSIVVSDTSYATGTPTNLNVVTLLNMNGCVPVAGS